MVIRQALRSLRRAPVYAGTVILTLSLGLGAVGAMFGLQHAVLWAPLPYGASERLVSLQLEVAAGGNVAHSPAILETYRRHARQFEQVALYRSGNANVWSGREELGAEHLTASWISPSMIPLLQVPPRLGRAFSEEEGRRGGPEAVMLSEAEWRTRFAAAPDVIGRTLIVNEVPREIVGVMPTRFAFPDAGTRLWLPVKVSDTATAGEFLYSAVARLAPGATAESARLELMAVLPRMAEWFPQLQSGGATADWLEDVQLSPRVQSLRAAITAPIAPTLWMLAAVAGLVLLVAWANVANLLLIRADARRQEVAVRQALGASPRRASAQLLAEAGLLVATATTLALLAAQGALQALRSFGPADLPRLAELGMSAWSAGLIVLLALLGMLFGAALLVRFDRSSQLSGRLHSGARGQTSGGSQQRLRATASVLQIAAAVVVLALAAVLLRTAQRLHDVQPGFDPAQVSTFRILLPFARYGDAARVAFHAELNERVRLLPSVQAAGLSARLPLGAGLSPEQDFLRAGDTRRWTLPVNVVSDGYFAAMRIPLLAGRDFRALDRQRPDEILISQRAAMLLFADASGRESLGKTLHLDPGGPTYTIVGVVGDVHYADLASPPAPMLYRPQVVASTALQPGPLPAMVLSVRSEGPAEALVGAVRAIVRDLDPAVPLFEVRSMRAVVRDSMARLTLVLWVMTAAAGVSLLLGMVGLYGLMAYAVSLRTREFGLRLALGAQPRTIVRSVLWRGLRLSAVGMATGLLLFVLLVPALRASIAGIAAWDPLPLAGALVLLAGTAALACWIPARRAAAVDPATALRAD